MRTCRLSRHPLWLLALTLAAFAVQTDDFIIVGVLPALADSVDSSTSAVGQLVTVYSLTYALAAPVWALALSGVSRHRALCVALAVFTFANVAVLPVNSLPVLTGLRVVAALAAAVVLPCALAEAATHAPPKRRGSYLATVMTGLTGAVLIGVPAGTWIGATLGWRATFVFAGLLGLAALLLVHASLPRTARSEGEQPSVAALLRPLLAPVVPVILMVTTFAVAGNLAFQTYLAPFLGALAGARPTTLAALLICSGAGGLVGTQLAGLLVDRRGPLSTFAGACAVFCATMLALAALWTVRPVPVIAVAALLAGWSAAAWAIPPSLQALLLARAGAETAAQSMAVLSSTVYVGAALGASLGGVALRYSPVVLPLAAVATTVAALGLALAFARARPDVGAATDSDTRTDTDTERAGARADRTG